MRLKADLWVRAYLRRCEVAGVPGVIVQRGDPDAGAIFISINRLNGTVQLFGPAPAGLQEAESDRRFVPLAEGQALSEAEGASFLARERDFDSDIWIIELEERNGRHLLDEWLAEE